MSQMLPRIVDTTSMTPRQSVDRIVSHYSYEEPQFVFENSRVSYEYASYRGEMEPREIKTVQMRGR